MIQFRHSELNNGVPLTLRLGPTKVEWTYNLNTSVQDTYGGQIVQILSINFDKLSIEGMFGKEGPHGKIREPEGNKVVLNPHKAEDYWRYNTISFSSQPYSVGLTQMTAYFMDYFAIASQGGDNRKPGLHYVQEPMEIIYTGALDDTLFPHGERSWKAYPINFPSYSRAISEFAPKWKIDFEVEEADYSIKQASLDHQLSNIRRNIGFTPYWQFSDPISQWAGTTGIKDLVQAEATYREYLINKFDVIMEWLPTLTAEEQTDLLFSGASIPETLKRAKGQDPAAGDGDHGIRTDTSKPPGQNPIPGKGPTPE